jgi:hypothetical protein
MTFLKRCGADLACDSRFQKRQCSGPAGEDVLAMRDAGAPCAVPMDSGVSAEACAWLEGLSRSLHGGLSAQSSTMVNLSERTW